MNDVNPPTITPSSPGNQAADPRRLDWSRAAFEASSRRLIKRGEPDKADLWRVDRDGLQAVVKDFRDKAWWVRWLGRLQIRREVSAYRHLEGVEGVPRLYARIDAWALALQWIDGVQLGRSADRTRDGADRLRQLRAIVKRIHARGVVHWDLRARENVILDRGGRVWVLDFASAVRLEPGSRWHRWLFPRLVWIDESACLKWKGVLDAGPFNEAERAFLERHRFWRGLWLHRRGRPGADGGQPS